MSHDRRLTPARSDLAASRYRGLIEAERYVDGRPARIGQTIVGISPEPRPDLSIDTQAIFGEAVTVYEDDIEGWSWVELARDGYVGYLPTIALTAADLAPSHYVSNLRTLTFPGPDFKLPATGFLPEMALVTVREFVERRGTGYAILSDGSAVIARHLTAIGLPAGDDFVDQATRFIGTPYQWGGRTSLGIDCSGLVQTALALTGRTTPRDSDMQAKGLGEPVVFSGDMGQLQRGDLLFWKGHVAIVAGPDQLLHANGYHMATVIEPLRAAVERIAAAGSAITGLRRL